MITFYKIILAHLLGDYVLQIDFIAKTKGKNMYHLIVHCFLYSIPFVFAFGFDYRVVLLLISHFVADIMKARYKKISYTTDQLLHYAIALVYLV